MFYVFVLLVIICLPLELRPPWSHAGHVLGVQEKGGVGSACWAAVGQGDGLGTVKQDPVRAQGMSAV